MGCIQLNKTISYLFILLLLSLFLSCCVDNKNKQESTISEVILAEDYVDLTIAFKNNTDNSFNITSKELVLEIIMNNTSNYTVLLSELYLYGDYFNIYIEKNNISYAGGNAGVYSECEIIKIKPGEKLVHSINIYNIGFYNSSHNISDHHLTFPEQSNYTIWVMYSDYLYGEDIISNKLEFRII